ncbi:hypothetical protein ALP99_04342 [Pseudomonas syringae pv. tomato]|nr:Uncharacterized protein ALO87_01777 [Pseudomonas syringae pv. apii]KPW52284.1 Uncharacterized protein ALO88_01291 [Pseudomonas syringae pv. antirrhini]KPW54124.1 Uncharacterized protein ALO86_02729 [Pseudomonas syringae pv. berberidis]KPX70767.1 Uncharacterized protein ALO84_02638 [Pseudomonas syringae pv. maculicola]KPY09802.1 Uncharacterized protein ALO54_01297 [Pseudomonas syringae pv. philadelphi]KPY93271.1 hypothetical protein ALO36_100508 [Pseudomonas syringae pv. tomato]KPZ15512.1 U
MMVKYEIRLWAEDTERHNHPVIAIEFYEEDELQEHALIKLYPHGRYKIIEGELGRDEDVLHDLALAFRKKVGELADW